MSRLTFLSFVSESKWTREATFDGKVPMSGLTITSRSLIHCGKKCLHNNSCVAFFFESVDNFNCELQDHILSSTDGLSDKNAVTYYILYGATSSTPAVTTTTSTTPVPTTTKSTTPVPTTTTTSTTSVPTTTTSTTPVSTTTTTSTTPVPTTSTSTTPVPTTTTSTTPVPTTTTTSTTSVPTTTTSTTPVPTTTTSTTPVPTTNTSTTPVPTTTTSTTPVPTTTSSTTPVPTTTSSTMSVTTTTTTVSPSTTTTSSFYCPSGGTPFTTVVLTDGDIFTFKVAKVLASQSEARGICMNHGAFLARVTTVVKMNYLLNLIRTCSDYSGIYDYYVDGSNAGASDFFAAGAWVMDNGELVPMTSDFWGPGYPNYPGSQHCLRMTSEENYMWDDCSCSATHYFICEQ